VTVVDAGRFALEGRVALITGGGTGIGRGTAQVLAEFGADLVLAGRRPEPLERAADELRALGRQVLVVPTDVTDADQCEGLVAAAIERFGHLDILVNNAGGADPKPPLEWTVQDWHDTIDVNLTSVWLLSRAAAKPMLDQGRGAIVNISSGASLMALPNAAPYGAAKAGVNNLTGALSAAWSTGGVRVNAIAVGAVLTEMSIETARARGVDEQQFGARNGLGRAGYPDEIGHVVLFFASDAGSFVSGQTLWVNGGPQAPSYP
jgi:NAD(P)-dependent dehydrogenase (short-subunit alcohol dehydrogenase family)